MSVGTKSDEDLLHKLQRMDLSELHSVVEQLTRMAAVRNIKPGQVVIDIGANVGWHTRLFSSLVGEGGVVHAFEPNPQHWSALLEIANTRLWPLAVGDVVSIETFFAPSVYDQAASLHDPRAWIGGDTAVRVMSVPQAPIDRLQEIPADAVSFVKIDAEQHELQALKGMTHLLRESRPIVILENSSGEIDRLMDGLGYARFELAHSLFPENPVQMANVLYARRGSDPDTLLPSAEDVAVILNGGIVMS